MNNCFPLHWEGASMTAHHSHRMQCTFLWQGSISAGKLDRTESLVYRSSKLDMVGFSFFLLCSTYPCCIFFSTNGEWMVNFSTWDWTVQRVSTMFLPPLSLLRSPQRCYAKRGSRCIVLYNRVGSSLSAFQDLLCLKCAVATTSLKLCTLLPPSGQAWALKLPR